MPTASSIRTSRRQDACKGVTRPAALMGPHAAVMGVKFYTGKMFPAEYQNTMFVVRKGSWNRTKPTGFDVVNARIGEDGKVTYKPFATGFQQGGESYNFWGRPAYVAQMPDGALLVSDEQTGAIYRISYERPKTAAEEEAVVSSVLRKGRWACWPPPFSFPASHPQDRVAACAACHGPGGNSVTAGIPSIAGQPRLFVENQLVLFREEIRKSTGDDAADGGHEAIKEIQQLAEHFSKQEVKVVAGPADKKLLAEGQRWQRSCAAASAISPTSAARSRCRASPGSARSTSKRRCGPTATTSARRTRS